mmetsp:Transcript_2620/g.3625  ORF Transcript_2620/g.3625 Transcript_2620/m.3625 type:complete len:125 (-) Transcript_2620:29-403(-)
MKKLISTIAFVLGVVALSFAQEATNTAASQGSEALETSKTSGSYVFTLPQGTTSDEVTQAASYYKNNFTVEYDAGANEAAIKIIGDPGQSRQIMIRFLSGCGVAYVDVDGTSEKLMEFHANHLK